MCRSTGIDRASSSLVSSPSSPHRTLFTLSLAAVVLPLALIGAQVPQAIVALRFGHLVDGTGRSLRDAVVTVDGIAVDERIARRCPAAGGDAIAIKSARRGRSTVRVARQLHATLRDAQGGDTGQLPLDALGSVPEIDGTLRVEPEL